jgi:hypothetical protein
MDGSVDTESRGGSTSPKEDPDRRRERRWVGLLGVNAWAVGLLLPQAHVGLRLGDAPALLAPLLALAGGVGLLGRSAQAAPALLVGFPALLILGVALDPRLALDRGYGATTATLAAISLLAAVAAAAHAVGRIDAAAPGHRQRPASRRGPVAEPLRRRWLRRGLLTLSALGALVAGNVAVAWGSRRELVAGWGPEAATDGATLTAVVATLVVCVALAAIVGPALRAERRRRERPSRVGLWLGLSAIGLFGWWLLVWMGR